VLVPGRIELEYFLLHALLHQLDGQFYRVPIRGEDRNLQSVHSAPSIPLGKPGTVLEGSLVDSDRITPKPHL